MKTLNLVVIMVLLVNVLQAQNNEKEDNNTLFFGGIGYGVIKSDNEATYNLNYQYSELSYNTTFNEEFGLASGLSLIQLSGTGFNSVGNFYQERSVFQIPISLTYNKEISETSNFFGSFGVYGQTIFKDEYQYLDQAETNVYEGWNFGFNLKLGILFDIYKNIEGGFVFSSQSDLTKVDSDSSLINDSQKMTLNSIGLVMRLNL